MRFHELWSQEDQMALHLFEVALRHDDLAGALLAVEGASPVGSAETREHLHDLGTRARELATATDPSTALVRVLVDQEHFHGDADDYYHPRNSYLSRVLERRKGLPILLSTVWMLVGEEAGVPVEGIGLPGHFVVRVGGAEGVLIDPFAGGHMLSVGDCANLVNQLSSGQLAWDESFLAATPQHALIERVLRNLLTAFQRRGEPEMLFRTARFFTALKPNEAEPRLVHARLAEAMGARQWAMDLYREIEDRFPGTMAADIAGTRLVELRDQPFEIN